MKQLIENKVEELLSEQFCLSRACLRGNQTVFTVKAEKKKPYLKILAYKNCVAVCSSEELSDRLRCGLTHSGPYWTEVSFMMI